MALAGPRGICAFSTACCQDMHPAWVNWTSSQMRLTSSRSCLPAEIAYLPIRESGICYLPGEVAYLPVPRKECPGADHHEAAEAARRGSPPGTARCPPAGSFSSAEAVAGAVAIAKCSRRGYGGHDGQDAEVGSIGGAGGSQGIGTGSPAEAHGSQVTGTCSVAGAEARASALIKNLPSRCSEEDVADAIDRLGFRADVAELSMPTRVGKGNRLLNRGFAFVTFSSVEVCRQFAQAAQGHRGFGKRLSCRAISVVFPLMVGGASREESPRSAGSQL
ncbi:unnamed protein product [Prorocentrum cordatum]|uniref:RRM domain-containing protein n=1 Tax=Prorocentrum cordatum TaxID=2364126 RepID=A0ABN9RS98_9DINO|nr:unnamed protein product [Polarella glacialis]